MRPEITGLLRQGWAHYGAGEYEPAVAQFEQARHLAPDDPEPAFGLGLSHKLAGRKAQAIAAFREAAAHAEHLTDRTRATMLRRLALGHVNRLERGQWDLEKEVWGRA
jgi:tetratricopeptide (TPR) repeat protein